MLPAIILGLLWFRILGFLKVVNEQLATFIVALKKVSAFVINMTRMAVR